MTFGGIDLITGTDESRRAAREAHRREQRLRIAMRSGWPELARKDLVFGRYVITHTPSAVEYRVMRGEIDAIYSPVAAYFLHEDGTVSFLEAA